MMAARPNQPYSWDRRWRHATWFCLRLVVLPVLRLTIGLRGYGMKHVPKRGGAIVIANHIDWFDPVLLIAVGPRPMSWMAKAEVFTYPILRWIARQTRAFPVERGKPDRAALRRAQQLLDEGRLVGVFPEGTRSRAGGLIAPFAGASLLAIRSQSPIIPCAIVGSEALPLRGFAPKRPGRPRVTAVYGEPFTLDAQKDDGGKWSLAELTDAMMIELARLLPPDYRGVYAERACRPHPAVRRDEIRWTGLS